jgi:phytoene desaturase
MAPPGGDSLTVLLPVPNLSSRQVEWARDGAEVRESVLTALESPTGLGLEGIRERVRLERAWTPLDFQQALGAVEGNAFGPEPVLLQSASFRQPNRDRQIKGLYYVGAGTHPGAGIPGVLMGAAITAGLVVEG